MARPESNAVVAQRVDVASGLMILRVMPKGWELPPFKAGQYTVLGLPGRAPRAPLTDEEPPPADPDKLIRRAYSIASSSVENEYLEFYVTLVRSGSLTPRLFALGPGDPLWLSSKFVGMFTLDRVPAGQNILLVATGTGIAPYMSMLRSHLQEIRGPRVAVVHGARHSWDLGYRAELSTMQRLVPAFSYVPVVSSPDEETVPWKGRAGFIHQLWQDGSLTEAMGFEPSPATTHVFLCGNPLMIEAMMGQLAAEGFTEHTHKQPGNIHLEKFW
jgi:ferredoxin--NADP+ reductase